MGRGFAEMMRNIREDTPHKPSTRLSTLGDTSTRTAEQRHTDIKKLGTVLRGDLDWIVMRCLEKNRTRRYDTATGLAADINRHLNDEPVEAWPPSAGYKLRKFVRRNKGMVVTGSAVAAALVVGMAGTSLGLWRAELANLAKDVAIQSELEAKDDAQWDSYTANIALAQMAMDNGNWPEARARIAACPESKRGWEWELLRSRSRAIIWELPGESDPVQSLDAKRILTYSLDGFIRVRDLESMRVTCPPNTPILRDDSHIEWTRFWGAGQFREPQKKSINGAGGNRTRAVSWPIVSGWRFRGSARNETRSPSRSNTVFACPILGNAAW